MPEIKTTHKDVKEYYLRRAELINFQTFNELSIRDALQRLLQTTAARQGLILVPEQTLPGNIRPDGVIYDEYKFRRGVWEAKDSKDDLDTEIRNKRKAGYPFDNILFENNIIAVLIQNSNEVLRCEIDNKKDFIELLNAFFNFNLDYIDDFEKAVDEFKKQIPEIGAGLKEKIDDAHESNKRFQASYETFYNLCRNSLNPNISREAVDEMIIQHLLTERVLSTVFNSPGFANRNPIAVEVKKVISALTSKSFNRHEFLGRLDRFYLAIEEAALHIEEFSEKQFFLNTIYERFFQGYSVKTADTHGIVYTPMEIVDFMVASVGEVLETEFGKQIGDPGINILDPCTGTGSYIVNLLRKVAKENPEGLERAYREQFFANEVMLMPYYIAALNIEHEYFDLTKEYEIFEGVCFVDTLDIVANQGQLGLFTEVNSDRITRQKEAPIFVVIGNPPYNAGQVNENDNNQNRKYEVVDKRIKETYAEASKATLQRYLYDPYVKFFRWAADRLKDEDGIVCFISNNSFIEGIAFDGMRKHLVDDYSQIYHFNFKGNARTSGVRRQKEGGNIFNDLIRVSVGITILVRNHNHKNTKLFYHEVGDYWRAEKKKQYLTEHNSLSKVLWTELHPNEDNDWIIPENKALFDQGLPLGTKDVKKNKGNNGEAIFKVFSCGIVTSRDAHCYSFYRKQLIKRVKTFVDIYMSALGRYIVSLGDLKNFNFEKLIDVNDPEIKWSHRTKEALRNKHRSFYKDEYIRKSLYRPYCLQYLYYDDFWVERRYQTHRFLPGKGSEDENRIICVSGKVSTKPFQVLITQYIPDFHLTGDTQCFAFYRYEEDGNRIENITDWALEQFRTHYKSKRITKWDIFYYVYGLLHHPQYSSTFKDSLKKQLPRIPYAPDFFGFREAGETLADLHLNYEKIKPYPLKWVTDETAGRDFSVKKMYLRDLQQSPGGHKGYPSLEYNAYLTLTEIPLEAYDYRLGNRSALEWIVDRYQVKTDKRTGIVNDPNDFSSDSQYIVKLIGRVVQVSMQTVEIVKNLPVLFLDGE